MAQPSRPAWLGQTAYEAYGASSGRSGRKDWPALHPAIQANWTAAGEAVYAQLLDDFDLIGDPALVPDAQVAADEPDYVGLPDGID